MYPHIYAYLYLSLSISLSESIEINFNKCLTFSNTALYSFLVARRSRLKNPSNSATSNATSTTDKERS